VAGIRWNEDDELLIELAEALREAHDGPREFVEAGKAAYTWRNIDAELAALVYDSEHEPAVLRSDVASRRALTFSSRMVTIELAVTTDGLLGQVLPECAAHLEVQTHGDATVSVTADDLGMFAVRPAPSEPFRIRCRFDTSIDVLTPLINL
jgi:hypothetical protein